MLKGMLVTCQVRIWTLTFQTVRSSSLGRDRLRVCLPVLPDRCVLLVADMARDSPVGSPVVSRRNDLNNLNNTYHIDPGLHEQAFQQQILQVS
jgi:hypothetical protein